MVGPLEGIVIDLGSYTTKLAKAMNAALADKYGKPNFEPDSTDIQDFNAKKTFVLPTLYDQGTVAQLLIWYTDGIRVQLAYHPKREQQGISSDDF